MKTPACTFPLLAAAVLLTGVVSAAQAASTERIFIEYAPGAGAMVRDAVVAEHGVIHYRFDRIDAIAVSLGEAATDRIARNPRVLSMEPDPKRYLAAKPLPETASNPYLEQVEPYGIDHVQAPMAWSEGVDGEGITVCIIDTGLAANHEGVDHEDINDDFVLGGTNQTGQSDWFNDSDGHGTHVAGIVTAADNDVGVIGVSPGKVSLYIVKIFGDDGLWTQSSDLVAAAFTCSENGARVINMSLSGSSGPNAERKAFEALYNEDGILSVAAASNDGTRQRVFPASYDSVISVAATDREMLVADFSNQNQWVELSAPGVGVLSSVPFKPNTWLYVGSEAYAGLPMEFSPYGEVFGELANGGQCLPTDLPGDWSGKVILCERGEATFAEKVTLVMAGGGSTAVIYDNVDEELFSGTLGEAGVWIPTISLSQQDGWALLPKIGEDVTVYSAEPVPGSGYEAWGGTSMATPHVVGVAALLWSYDSGLTNVQIREAMTATALDLGEPGRDIAYGYGLVQAYDALQYLSLIHISEPTRRRDSSRMPSSA